MRGEMEIGDLSRVEDMRIVMGLEKCQDCRVLVYVNYFELF